MSKNLDNRNKILESELDKEIRESLKKNTSDPQTAYEEYEELKYHEIKDSFIDKMQETKTKNEFALTDNDALVYASSGSDLVDFNFNLASKRSESEEKVAEDFLKIYYKDKETALRYLFFARDIIAGCGERDTFRKIFKNIAKADQDVGRALIPIVPEYGRWDDLLPLLDTPLKKDVVNLFKIQLNEDLANYEAGKDISILAKWLPSVNASKKETKRYGKKLTKEFGLTEKEYRKMLSCLRDKLNIIEKALAQKDIEKLEEMQEKFSSKQNLKYNKALMNIMPEKRLEFFNKVLRGEANMNVGVLEPHEIYCKYNKSKNGYYWGGNIEKNYSFEVMWNQLPNKVTSDKEVLVVRDGSGSMTVSLYKSQGSVLDVASALTVYFSEHSTGKFKDKFITFSSRPEIVDMSNCESLCDKINLLNRYDDCSNTNIEKTFDLILQTAIDNKMTQEDMPANVLIVSDMQFDYATNCAWDKTLFDNIRDKFESAGYKLPGLIFWNVNQRESAIPEIKNELGLVLLGGYSKNNIDMICKDEFVVEVKNEKGEVEKVTLSPEEILMNTIMSERYDLVSDCYKNIDEIKKDQTKDVPEINFSGDER